MGYMYPKRAASSSESSERPAKRRCTDKGKEPERVAFSTEAATGTAVASELPTVPALPRGFPPPPSGYELLFEAWGDKWRELHGDTKACGDLQVKLFGFLEAAKMNQDKVVEAKRNFIASLHQAITQAREKLLEVKIIALPSGKPADPERVKHFEKQISEFIADLTLEEEELNKLQNTKKLDETRQAIQGLLETSTSTTGQLKYEYMLQCEFCAD
ncbi:hypothetical protein H4R20_003993 [Coemansia guatemalensis]|uniref:Uncharacterized protein n=1 Tax=Coemansia guatemalensis TaxID=2761395 RepID=A0A9W8HSL0_9FUNG|nr:hypothetical protein H4R20_003993 [Coemansia guatemalensis]